MDQAYADARSLHNPRTVHSWRPRARRRLRRSGAQKRAGGTSAPARAEAAALGRAYQVLGSESLLIVRVYRGGTLARAGHNHIVASHDLAGTVYVAADLSRSSFELRAAGGVTHCG